MPRLSRRDSKFGRRRGSVKRRRCRRSSDPIIRCPSPDVSGSDRSEDVIEKEPIGEVPVVNRSEEVIEEEPIGLDCREELVQEETLDFETKMAALKASQCVVSIATHFALDSDVGVVSDAEGEDFFVGSGTIIECQVSGDGRYASTILATASLFDPEDVEIDVYLSDGKLYEGKFIACDLHYNLAAVDDGGAVINCNGDVIGIMHPFLPINIVSRWWAHFKLHGKYGRPWLGIKVANLYAARLDFLEQIAEKFPQFSTGVLVIQVAEGSPAYCSGIRPKDVIVQCDGRPVQSKLEFFEKIWDRIGEQVEVSVLRTSTCSRLNLHFDVGETTPEKFYKWKPPLCRSTNEYVKGLEQQQ